MKFKVSLDWLAEVITALVTILLLVILAIKGIPLYRSNPFEAITLGFLIVGIYSYCLLFRPLNYSLTSNELKIHRPVKDVIIRLALIKSIRLFTADERRFTLRTFGVGGLFGYFGRFRNPRIGKLTMYATRRNRTVLIETIEGEKIILTPDEPDVFVSVLKALKCRKIGENYIRTILKPSA